MKIFFAAILLVFFLLFACVTSSSDFSPLESKPFDVGKIKAMLNDPSVEVKEAEISAEQILPLLLELNKSCGGKLVAKQYSVINVSGKTANISVYVDKESNLVACAVRKEKQADQCATAADCVDGLSSTVDACSGSPKVCLNERIKDCRGGDFFCPQGCIKNNDSDCLAECVADSGCDDQNNLTSDSCSGLIKVCSNEIILVGGKPLRSCETDSGCLGENSCVVGVCGEGRVCSYSNVVDGTICGLTKECFGGECVDKALNKISISGAQIKGLSENSVEISWKTNKLGRSEVKYGLDILYVFSKTDSAAVVGHKVVLSGLEGGKKYVYKIFSPDVSNLGVAEFQPFDNSFFTCLGKCSDSDSCTADSCDISSGVCVHKKDISKAGC